MRLNYKNNTANVLTLSLNKIRMAANEPLLKAKAVKEYIAKNFESKNAMKSERRTHLLPIPAKSPGRSPIVSASDQKTEAMKSFAMQCEDDDMSISLSELLAIPDEAAPLPD